MDGQTAWPQQAYTFCACMENVRRAAKTVTMCVPINLRHKVDKQTSTPHRRNERLCPKSAFDLAMTLNF